MSSILRLAKFALNTQHKEVTDTDLYEDFSEEERKPLLTHMKHFTTFDIRPELPPQLFSRGISVETQNWLEEFASMNLPPFSMQYIQLIHVPLDVMRECLKLQVELGKDVRSPSPHTVKQVCPSPCIVTLVRPTCQTGTYICVSPTSPHTVKSRNTGH